MVTHSWPRRCNRYEFDGWLQLSHSRASTGLDIYRLLNYIIFFFPNSGKATNNKVSSAHLTSQFHAFRMAKAPDSPPTARHLIHHPGTRALLV